jgi:uncharacterized protein YndB with AHSA1/START domain
MTTHKTLKRRVRARMDKTGERYTAARRNVLAEPAAPEPAAAGAPPPVSDDAVRKGTGRGWDEWFAILDDAGAASWKHPDIARWVAAEFGISGWWAQGVTVGFERARGLRARHERPSGFSVSVTKTVNVPVERLYDAFGNARERKAWLEHAVRVSSGTPPRTINFPWGDGSRVAVRFEPRGPAKSQVALQQEPLPDAAAVEELRTFWRARLASLKGRLEADAPQT